MALAAGVAGAEPPAAAAPEAAPPVPSQPQPRLQLETRLGAPPKTCEGPEHRQFDFWVGEWIVTTPDGRQAGDNKIESILGGCALTERWRGTAGTEGHSYNAYDRSRQAWHQTWVDGQGNLLSLEGGLRGRDMVLSGRQGKALHRITWSPRPDGTIAQVWESSDDEGETWKTVFQGLYVPRHRPQGAHARRSQTAPPEDAPEAAAVEITPAAPPD